MTTRAALSLTLGRPHHEAIEDLGHLDLTRQPGVWLHAIGKVEHVLFHRRRLADLLAPAFVDIDVTGRARTGTAALRFDSWHALLDRRLHDGRADFAFDRASCTLDVDESDFDHVGRRSLEEKTRCRRGMRWTIPAGVSSIGSRRATPVLDDRNR